VYVGSYHNIYAINATTGDLKWMYTTGGGVESSPALGPDGTVFVGSNDKKIYAILYNAPSCCPVLQARTTHRHAATHPQRVQPALQELTTLFRVASHLQRAQRVPQEHTTLSPVATLPPIARSVQKALTVHLADLLVHLRLLLLVLTLYRHLLAIQSQ
jgi:hypothetical protein